MDHEIWRGNQLLERLMWAGPAWTGTEAQEEQREDLRARSIMRAYELGGLAFERRNPNWLESDHTEFQCRECSETEVEVDTPLGTFVMQARRARAGETITSVVIASTVTAYGRAATEDQLSLPIQIFGRLNPPMHYTGWTFQPDHFVYADSSHSDFLGGYPRDITWANEPDWPVGNP